MTKNPNLISIENTKIYAEVDKPYYFSIWLVKDCVLDFRYNKEDFILLLDKELDAKKDFMLLPKKSGNFKIQVIATPTETPEPEPEPEINAYIYELANTQELLDLPEPIVVNVLSSLVYQLALNSDFDIEKVVLNDSSDVLVVEFIKEINTNSLTFKLSLLDFPSDFSFDSCKICFIDSQDTTIKEIALEEVSISTHELVVNGTEGSTTIMPPPSVNDSATTQPSESIPATPLTPAETKSQFIILEIEVGIEMPLGMYEFFKTFPELKPTATTKEGLEKWQNTMNKVKCIYQEYSQPQTICDSYPLFVLTAHYGVINGLAESVGIVRADGVVASSSVGDVSVSFQTQPYGSNEFTYFLGLTKYGLEFLAWLNRRSGLYYAN